MAHLMGEGQVHLFGRKVVAVVLKCDETRVTAGIVTTISEQIPPQLSKNKSKENIQSSGTFVKAEIRLTQDISLEL